MCRYSKLVSQNLCFNIINIIWILKNSIKKQKSSEISWENVSLVRRKPDESSRWCVPNGLPYRRSMHSSSTDEHRDSRDEGNRHTEEEEKVEDEEEEEHHSSAHTGENTQLTVDIYRAWAVWRERVQEKHNKVKFYTSFRGRSRWGGGLVWSHIWGFHQKGSFMREEPNMSLSQIQVLPHPAKRRIQGEALRRSWRVTLLMPPRGQRASGCGRRRWLPRWRPHRCGSAGESWGPGRRPVPGWEGLWLARGRRDSELCAFRFRIISYLMCVLTSWWGASKGVFNGQKSTVETETMIIKI